MEIFFFILDFIKLKVETSYYTTLLIFFFFLLIYSTFSIPGNIILVVSTGYFFGIYTGFLLSISTIVLGSLFFYLLTSFCLKKIFPNIIEKYSNRIDQYISVSSLEYLIIFRMIPGPPLMLQNLLLSFLNINKTKFIISSLLGFAPLVFISVFFGFHLTNFSNLKSITLSNIFSLDFILVLIFIIFLLLVRIFYKRKNN